MTTTEERVASLETSIVFLKESAKETLIDPVDEWEQPSPREH